MLKHLARPDVARAVSNLLWLGGERLVQVAVAILISGALARYFGPAVFGKWQYANTLLLIIAPLTWMCGAEILVPTLLRRDGADLDTVLVSAFALRLGVSGIALAGTWLALAAHWLDPLVAAMLAGLALTLVFREPFGVITAWLQSRTYSKPALLIGIATAALKALAVLLMVRLAVAPGRFGWLWGAEAAVIGAALLAYFVRHHPAGIRRRVDPALLREFATSGAVFWLGLIAMYLFLKLDRLMLERYVDFASLGRYAAAQQLNENWIMLALMLAQTLAPAFVYRVDERAALKRNVLRLTALAAALMACGALVLDLLGGVIVERVFGPGFAGAAAIFRWAVWLSVLAGIEAIGNLIILKYQAKAVLLVKWLMALAVAVLVNLWLIPRLGGYGALLGLACGYLSAVTVNSYYIFAKLAP